MIAFISSAFDTTVPDDETREAVGYKITNSETPETARVDTSNHCTCYVNETTGKTCTATFHYIPKKWESDAPRNRHERRKKAKMDRLK